MKNKKEIYKEIYVPPHCICCKILEENFFCTSLHGSFSTTEEEEWEYGWPEESSNDNWIEF